MRKLLKADVLELFRVGVEEGCLSDFQLLLRALRQALNPKPNSGSQTRNGHAGPTFTQLRLCELNHIQSCMFHETRKRNETTINVSNTKNYHNTIIHKQAHKTGQKQQQVSAPLSGSSGPSYPRSSGTSAARVPFRVPLKCVFVC